MASMTSLFVEQRRGFAEDGVVEAVHAVDAVSCDGAGKTRVLSGGDLVTTLRSAGKPFQLAVTLPRLDEATRGRLESVDLALGAASHHGERFHVAALEALLSRLGVGEPQLFCGAHPPSHAASAQALFARGEQPRAIHNNCAGKHAFMAAACRAAGDPADYRPAEHPLQRAVAKQVTEAAGQPPVSVVVDGCGVPCFALPLSAMARAYAELARETHAGGSTLGTIGRAMREHPLLVSGSDAFDGWLMEHAPVVAKVGALGLLCIAWPARGLGLAIKVRSGSELARPVATLALLRQYFPELASSELPSPFRAVTNVVGDLVGELATRFEAD
jgi:L-asparaginase II